MLLKDKKIFFNLQKLKSAQEIDEKDIYNISNDVAGQAGLQGNTVAFNHHKYFLCAFCPPEYY